MITKEQYLEDSKKKRELFNSQNTCGSQAISLFDNRGIFRKDNWNGNDILRQYVLDVYDGVIKNDDVEVIFKNDNWYVIIDMPEHTVFMKWYKSRGRTESIICDDYPISIDEYIEVYNYIRGNNE